MDAVFLKILNMSLTASWIVLAVLLLRLLLKRAPKWLSCLLWGVVGLRLIFPFSIESLFSLIPSAEPLPSDLPMTQAPAIDSGFEVIDEVVNPIIYDSFAPTPEVSANPLQIVLTVAGIVWLCGLIGMIAYGVVSYVRLRLRVRASIKNSDNVYFCDDIDSPFILGIIRPRIYLPSGMTDAQMGYVIGHEQAHLRRLDHIWKPLGFALLCLHWFNPLLWLAYILLCRDIESACDEKVICDMDNESKKGYSETLVACSVHRRAVMACPLAFGEVGVKDRIKSVLNYKKPAFWIILVAVVALVVTGVCFLTDPKSDTDADEALLRISNQKIRYTHIAYTAMTSFHLPADSPYLVLDLYINGETLYAIGSGGGLMKIGTLTSTTLTRQNFDSYFVLDNTLGEGPDARKLRKNNVATWEIKGKTWDENIDFGGIPWYLLLQKDGKVYCVWSMMWEEKIIVESAFGFEPVQPTSSKNSGTTADGVNWFVGTILEINNSSFLVEPATGTFERDVADKISVSRATSSGEDDLVMPYLCKGEEIYVYYTGGIAESYPAQINKVRMIVPKWATVVEQSKSSILYDVDNDGKKEYCVIGYGPQEDGKYIVGIRAWSEDETVLKYSAYFLSPHINSSLIVRSDGTLWIGGGTAGDGNESKTREIPRQIVIANGKMQLFFPYAYDNMTYDAVVEKLGEPLGEPTKEQGHLDGKAYTIYMYEFPFNEEWNLRVDFHEKNIDVGVKRQYVYHYSLTPKD